jgi:hypothetical protein
MKRSKLVRRLGVTTPNDPKKETRGKRLKAYREIQTSGDTSRRVIQEEDERNKERGERDWGEEGTVEEERLGIRFDVGRTSWESKQDQLVRWE